MSERGSPSIQRFVRAARLLLGFQLAAAAGATGLAIWAASEVRGVIAERDALAERVVELETRPTPILPEPLTTESPAEPAPVMEPVSAPRSPNPAPVLIPPVSIEPPAVDDKPDPAVATETRPPATPPPLERPKATARPDASTPPR